MTAPVTQAQRTPWVDQLRGLAVVWMVGYHLCFDLDWLGFTDFDMLGDAWWTTQRAAIVGLFVWTAGVSQVLAVRGQQSRAGFWRRWLQIAGCAALVSAASAAMFPQSWIYFGVLHGVAAMALLSRWVLIQRPRWWLIAGIGGVIWGSAWWVPAALSAWGGESVQALLNTPWLNWLGWVSAKPVTEDYVPLAPWLGVMCAGLAFGLLRWGTAPATRPAAGVGIKPAAKQPSDQPADQTAQMPSPLPTVAETKQGGMGAKGSATLAWVGRHSLSIYMLHQPLLLLGLGLLGGWSRF